MYVFPCDATNVLNVQESENWVNIVNVASFEETNHFFLSSFSDKRKEVGNI